MIYVHVRVKEILKEKKKTKYWLVKNMEGGYQSITRLIENSTIAIRISTIM